MENKNKTEERRMNMVPKDLIKGVVVGGLIGAGVGILYAPKSGKETREQIRHGARDVLEKAKLQYEEAVGKLETLKTQNAEMFADRKERLKKAWEAGLETYRQAADKKGNCMTGLYGDNSLL
jgi:gas vesicle protein